MAADLTPLPVVPSVFLVNAVAFMRASKLGSLQSFRIMISDLSTVACKVSLEKEPLHLNVPPEFHDFADVFSEV